VNVLLRFQGFLLLQILLLAGFLFALGYSVTRRSWRIIPAVVFLGWLFTYWGTDTRRYFLFLPVLLAFLYAWPLALAAQNFKLSKHRVVSFLIILGIGACILYAVQGGLNELRDQRKLDMMQCYRPSVGGIASMKDVGEWINRNTTEDDKVFGTSIYEWTYYTDREVWQDYRLYFLDKDRIDYYLSQVLDIKYVLVRDNQVIEPWKHVEWFPESFRDKIAEMYPVAYVSTYGDITVYRVVQQA